MARNEDHPDTRKRAASSREHAAKRANTWPKNMAGSEDELEAEALRQYAEEVRLHVPGFAVSAIPRRIVVPCKPSGTQTVSMHWNEPHRWKDARAELVDPWHYGDAMEPKVPKAWAYTKLVGDALPERFDLPNPKLYSLAGKLLPWTHPPGQVGRLLAGAFDALLVEVFQDAATNAKRAEVRAFLDHHRNNGGNPEALADHLHELVSKWRQAPPEKWNIYKAGNEPIPRHDILTDTVEEWLKEAPQAVTSAKGNGIAKNERPDLKLMALVHALRYLTNDKSADISKENAQTLANELGAMGKQSGKDLLDHFTRYTLKSDSKNNRLTDGMPNTVKRRYLDASRLLEGHPKAFALAESELDELYKSK
jgi:hypothetical protein